MIYCRIHLQKVSQPKKNVSEKKNWDPKKKNVLTSAKVDKIIEKKIRQFEHDTLKQWFLTFLENNDPH